MVKEGDWRGEGTSTERRKGEGWNEDYREDGGGEG